MNAKPALVRPHFASDLDPLAALYIARLSLNHTTARIHFNASIYSDELHQLVGIAVGKKVLSKDALRPLLKSCIDVLEQKLPRRKTALARNIDMLRGLLGLDVLQAEIVAFAALSKQHPLLCDIVDNIRVISIDGITRVLSAVLNVSDTDVRKAFRPDGQLLGASVVSIESNDMGHGLQIGMPDGLRDALFTNADNIQSLMSSFLEGAPSHHLKADAFEHLKRETDLLTAYLSKAISKGARGINILIYGVPGTGKTEYVRWLAFHQGKPLYQVRATDNQGNAIRGHDRLAFFQLSQRFLKSSGALMLFDEIEDVFPTIGNLFGMSFVRSPPAGKMFINRLLEENTVPTIWISNEVSHIDYAYLRRFDFSFEMRIPPIAVRRSILNKYLRRHAISDDTMTFLSQQEELSPAQIEKAAKVLKFAGEKPKYREVTLLHVIENSRLLLDQKRNDAMLSFSDSSYALDYLNPDCDLTQLVAQLKRAPNSAGALCFYGAPGTGKTALAHYIAHEIELPLLVRRASDILRPYVGETEQRIALMFRQAQQEGALLLLDEADSFLTERQSAKSSWEVTAVNEMLTQMERFDGLFICSTNLMQRLDTASLRRFALKIKFDFLKPEQRWQLFLAQARKLSRTREAEYRTALNQLNNLTPGDFATVRRQVKLLNVTLTADELLNRLRQECKNKRGDENRPMGFHAQ